VIKIGVIADMSSLYADISGPGSVVAAKLAVEDFGAAAKGMKIEIIFADHQNKSDLASGIVNSWIDVDKVDIVKAGQNLAGLLVFAPDVAALGLQAAQKLVLTETWYWDMNAASRTWTRRWQAERPPVGHWAGVRMSKQQSSWERRGGSEFGCTPAPWRSVSTIRIWCVLAKPSFRTVVMLPRAVC